MIVSRLNVREAPPIQPRHPSNYILLGSLLYVHGLHPQRRSAVRSTLATGSVRGMSVPVDDAISGELV